MSRTRRVAGAALALVAAATLAPIGPSTVQAGDGLVTVMDATYQVQPDNARVHVTVDAESTSQERDTPEGPVYYAGLTVSIPPGSSNVVVTSGGEPLPTTVTSTADVTQVDIGFSEQVFYGDSYAYRITFDMVDPGGAADRDFRIGRSVVAFPVWAFGTPGAVGHSVAVILPPTFTPAVIGGPLTETVQSDGSLRLGADVVNPQEWFAYVTAERPGIFTAYPFSLMVGPEEARILIRAWDDDPEWADRTQDLLTDGLPALRELIGLPWPVLTELKVEESANRLGDYAGIYDRQTEQINVRYDADATVTLHEAAHIWFNDDLFSDRWIGEAWAEFYAVHSADAIGVTGETFTLTDDLLEAQIPLNDWGAIGAEAQDVEAFAYAASYHLAGLIYERTDYDGLRAVWQAANRSETSYQPIHASDEPQVAPAVTQEGWQRLLDLLEERTDGTYADLWLEWVVDTSEAALLEERATARERYFQVVDAAGEWELPELIRHDLSGWRFDLATDELETADRVLELAADRDQLAGELALDPPDSLRQTFEGAGSLEAALTEANRELLALELVADATRGLAVEPEPVDWVGLLFAEPEVDLDLARDAWEAGDHSEASDHAEAVLTLLEEADDRGRERLAIGGGFVLVILAGGAILWRRGRPAPEPPLPGDEEVEVVEEAA